ncbi:excitatory amino acid transporter 3-like [Ptychodera flava]|uniref:excitatory amino acid transporter 3-like n=1 Tax=Ptychodera flava TaxID=63121 RepID=UPI003969D7D4
MRCCGPCRGGIPEITFSRSCLKQFAIDNLLLLLTLVGVIVGFIIGFALQDVNLSRDALMWIGLPGELFLRGLKLSILPLVVSCVTTAVATLDLRVNGKMGLMTFGYIWTVLFISCMTGLALVSIIQPGSVYSSDIPFQSKRYETQDVFADLFRNIIPENIVMACLHSTRTEYDLEKTYIEVNGTNITKNIVIDKYTAYGGSTNLLGVVIFCIMLGMAMSVERESSRTMLGFLQDLRVLTFRILTTYMWTLPVGTASLIAVALLRVENIMQVWKTLGLFSAAVIIGESLHMFVTLPLIHFIVARRVLYKVYWGYTDAILIAMITKSSAATLPTLIKGMEQNNKVHKSVNSFVLPLCATFNRDGSCMFIMSGCLWLAQCSMLNLNAGQIVVVAALAMIIAFSLPSVPSGSIVAIVQICTTTNIPIEAIGLLITMEWLLDAIRTGVNCVSHGVASATVHHRMVNELEDEDEESRDEEEGLGEKDKIQDGAIELVVENEKDGESKDSKV